MFTEPESGGALPRNDPLPVEHLQLPPDVTECLRRAEVSTVVDAVQVPDTGPALPTEVQAALGAATHSLRASTRHGEVDWLHYWRLRQFEFHHLAAALPELDLLASQSGLAPVNRTTLGNAGAMLEASGIRTLAQLVGSLRSGIAPVRGLGKVKLDALFAKLIHWAAEVSAGSIPEPLAQLAAPTSEEKAPTVLGDEARSLPIGILQLGPKGEWLRQAGYVRVGDLADAEPGVLRRIDAVGPRTVRLIDERLNQLAVASSSEGIDWHRYSELTGMPLVPAEPVTSGTQLLSILPQIFSEISAGLRDDGYRDIFWNRVIRGRDEQATLDEIARRSDPPVTRERIRQKEQKLLGQLTGALIWDRDARLGIQFHPSFARIWRDAAAEFEGVDEIAFDEFVSRLSHIWGVPVAELAPHLPFIVALVTGEAMMPVGFRAGARLPPQLFALQPETAAIRLDLLRLGKTGVRLADRNIFSFGAYVEAVAGGQLPAPFLEPLLSMAAAVDADGRFCWTRYRAGRGLPEVPSSPPVDAAAFVADFCATICSLLEALYDDGRASRIFEMRTSHPVRTRMTLEEVASMLGTYASSVKRDETEALKLLHEILAGRRFCDLPVWIRYEWLVWFDDARSEYDAVGDDYIHFVDRLSRRWDLVPSEAETAAAGLWAILSGYPEGRRVSRLKEPVEQPVPDYQVAPARIMLRGFRRLH